MASPKELLTHFSVTDDEAEIYLVLLKLGTATATEISDKAGKKRTAIHFHLKKLVDKDLMRMTKDGRTFMFTAVSPSELATRFDRATTDFKSMVPQLEALRRAHDEAPRVRVTESKSGFHKVYDEIASLPENSTFFAIEGSDALKNEFTLLSSKETEEFYTKIIARKIATKLIITEEAANLPNHLITKKNLSLLKNRALDVRTHPEQILPFQGLTLIYGDTIAYLFPKTNLVITINHEGIASSLKTLFDGLFQLGNTFRYQ